MERNVWSFGIENGRKWNKTQLEREELETIQRKPARRQPPIRNIEHSLLLLTNSIYLYSMLFL